jgi:hypothetical protein
MKKERVALARWTAVQAVREAIEHARAECQREGIEFDEAHAARMLKSAEHVIVIDDEAKPKGGRG